MLEPNTLLDDRYRLLEQTGEGGMATVYRAVDTRLGRTVAVKVLHPEFARDEPFLRRFQQEAEFAASLGAHPNIVDIYDIGEDGRYHYIVMAFVEGKNLKEMIQERAPFSVGEAFSIGAQVASALDFAHKRGLVHRDVKPQNILVTPEGMAKVTDFGIARSISTSQLTRPGMVIGTVHYFSPEQAQGKPATPASDVYSLGIIVYEMLTGHLPFDAESPIGVAMQHVHSEPPSPWEYSPRISARAVGTVMRALEKDPERRYRDAAEFASALSTQATPDLGSTTTFSPLPMGHTAAGPQRTAVYQQIESPAVEPTEYVVEEPARPTRASAAVTARPQMRTMWLALGAVLLTLAIALAAFFGTNYVLSGAKATATSTITPTATPRPKRKKPTPTPTVAVVFQPTSPPVIVAPTPTPTPLPLPTWTPVPPTPTPRPTPTPTPLPPPTSPPVPTPTPTPVVPTPTPTPVG